MIFLVILFVCCVEGHLFALVENQLVKFYAVI